MPAPLELLLVGLCLLLALAIALRQARRAVSRFQQPAPKAPSPAAGCGPGHCDGCPSLARCDTSAGGPQRSEQR